MSEAQSYVAAWLAREPGMELARVFVPPAQRALFTLWGALTHQLDETAFELSDAGVARTKLAWWGEELAAMSAGGARHPLARALSQHEAVRAVPAPDWHALANAALFAAGADHAPAEAEALLAPGAPYARVTARIEARVFATRIGFAARHGDSGDAGAADGDRGNDARAPAAEAVGVHHVLRRLEHSLGRDATQFPWPLNLRARHQAGPESFGEWRTQPAARAVLKDLALALVPRVETLRGATGFRRAQAALDARRLRHLAGAPTASLRATGPATLWALWRAARRG